MVSDTSPTGDVLDQIIQDGDLILAQGAGSVSKISVAWLNLGKLPDGLKILVLEKLSSVEEEKQDRK